MPSSKLTTTPSFFVIVVFVNTHERFSLPPPHIAGRFRSKEEDGHRQRLSYVHRRDRLQDPPKGGSSPGQFVCQPQVCGQVSPPIRDWGEHFGAGTSCGYKARTLRDLSMTSRSSTRSCATGLIPASASKPTMATRSHQEVPAQIVCLAFKFELTKLFLFSYLLQRNHIRVRQTFLDHTHFYSKGQTKNCSLFLFYRK